MSMQAAAARVVCFWGGRGGGGGAGEEVGAKKSRDSGCDKPGAVATQK